MRSITFVDIKQLTLFDDSFEHEVHHKGKSDRYVIYATVMHPDKYLPEDLVPGPYEGLPFMKAGSDHDEL